jgi:hypothetical protein
MPWPKGKSFSDKHLSKRIASFIANGGKRKQSAIFDGMECWQCPTCERWLPGNEFHKDKRTPNGLKSQCKSCHSESSLRTRDIENKRQANRFYERQRQAKKKDLHIPYAPHDLEQLKQILGWACIYCGSMKETQWDHIKPLAQGGVDHPVNMQPLCRKHNEIKQARYFDYRTTEQISTVEQMWVIEFKRINP